jgi:hypothetical protein
LIINLLILRLKQAQRALKSVGLFYGLLVVITYITVAYVVNYHHQKSQHTYVAFLLFLIIITIHYSRNDKKFLSEIFHNQAFIVHVLEYNFLILPLSFLLLIGDFPISFLILHLATSIIPFIELKLVSFSLLNSYLLLTFIPKTNFEWRSGMRKYQWGILVLYLLCIGLGFKFYGSFMILGLIIFSFSSFYLEFESAHILILTEKDSKSFVKNKLASELKLLLIFISPILILYFLKYPEYLQFYLPLLCMYFLNYIVFILNKYKSYIPNGYNNSNFGIVIIQFLGMFYPYLFPISLILAFVFYKKAINNLSKYLYAYNQ